MQRTVTAAVLLSALLGPASPAGAGSHWGGMMPAGEGKSATVKLCSTCHNLEKTVVARKTPQEWERTVYDMIRRGAPIFPDEADEIIKYLSLHFAP